MTPTDPAVAAPPKLMTANDFWDFVHQPGNENRLFELHDGEVIELSRPTAPHGRVCSRVAYSLEHYSEQTGLGYVVTNDAGVVLSEAPGTVFGPDIAYYTDVNTVEDLPQKWAETPPVLVVEVLSPNDKPNAMIAKMRAYLDWGVKLGWLVDYEDRTVAVFRLNQAPIVITEHQDLTGGDELPGFPYRVASFFRLAGERHAQSQPPPNS